MLNDNNPIAKEATGGGVARGMICGMARAAKLPPSPLEKRVVALLAAYLDKANLSMAAVAAVIGISRSQMSRIMAGHRGMTVSELDAICAVLGVVPSDVLADAESDTYTPDDDPRGDTDPSPITTQEVA